MHHAPHMNPTYVMSLIALIVLVVNIITIPRLYDVERRFYLVGSAWP